MKTTASHHELVAEAYRAYGHSVLRRARQILGNEQEARDVLQEVFVALLTGPGKFSGQSSLCTYLYSVATHMCLNRIRNRKNRERLRAERGDALGSGCEGASPDILPVLREVLALLSEDEARAAIHHYADGMTHLEIAGLLGCSRRRVGELLERVQLRLAGPSLERWERLA